MVARRLKGASAQVPNVSSLCPGPVLLALDGHSQPFPWESLPSVRDQEFYRVPSLGYVREARAVVRQGPRAPSVNWGNAYFLLNPSGDLESVRYATSDPGGFALVVSTTCRATVRTARSSSAASGSSASVGFRSAAPRLSRG